VETANGLLVRVSNVETWAWAQRWWNGLTEEEKRTARQDAEAYESLSKEERDTIWKEFQESIEVDAEGDEIDLPAIQRPAR
jgi:hypothetical protein